MILQEYGVPQTCDRVDFWQPDPTRPDKTRHLNLSFLDFYMGSKKAKQACNDQEKEKKENQEIYVNLFTSVKIILTKSNQSMLFSVKDVLGRYL